MKILNIVFYALLIFNLAISVAKKMRKNKKNKKEDVNEKDD